MRLETLNNPADAVAPSAQPLSARPAAQLHGRMLTVARGVWLVIATLTFSLVLVSLPAEYERFRTPCTGPGCSFLSLTPDDLADLSRMGLSLDAFAVYVLVC